MKSKEYWIERLELQPHPEGGFYRETYRSEMMERFSDLMTVRNVSTGIYFLLTQGNFSSFHKIQSDEMWHYYTGSPVTVYVIHKDGSLQEIKLGLDLDNGEVPQAVVPAGAWFGSRIEEGDGDYSLVGCTVAPGFDFADFQLAERDKLTIQFPQHELIISELTRQ